MPLNDIDINVAVVFSCIASRLNRVVIKAFDMLLVALNNKVTLGRDAPKQA